MIRSEIDSLRFSILNTLYPTAVCKYESAEPLNALSYCQLGHQWFSRFFERNPQYDKRKQKPLATDRKNSHSLTDMKDYFYKLKAVMRDKGIIEVDVWNMDETGFRIGCGRAQMVIIMNPKKPLRMMDSDNRDYITTVECISSGGEVIPSLIIISGVQILHKWCQENDLHDDILIGTSDSGYSSDDLAMDWLNHFIEHASSKMQGAWLLLIAGISRCFSGVPK